MALSCLLHVRSRALDLIPLQRPVWRYCVRNPFGRLFLWPRELGRVSSKKRMTVHGTKRTSRDVRSLVAVGGESGHGGYERRLPSLTQLGHGRAGLDFVAHRQIRKSTNCADPYRDSQRIGLQGLLAALHSALQHSIYSSRSLI